MEGAGRLRTPSSLASYLTNISEQKVMRSVFKFLSSPISSMIARISSMSIVPGGEKAAEAAASEAAGSSTEGWAPKGPASRVARAARSPEEALDASSVTAKTALRPCGRARAVEVVLVEVAAHLALARFRDAQRLLIVLRGASSRGGRR